MDYTNAEIHERQKFSRIDETSSKETKSETFGKAGSPYHNSEARSFRWG